MFVGNAKSIFLLTVTNIIVVMGLQSRKIQEYLWVLPSITNENLNLPHWKWDLKSQFSKATTCWKKFRYFCANYCIKNITCYGHNWFETELISIDKNREPLLKGMAQYSWPPCTNQFRSAHFYIENMIYLGSKTSYLNEEVNCTEPSPSVSVPW